MEKVLMGGWLLTVSVLDIRFRRVPIWLLIVGGVFAAVLVWCGSGGEPVGYHEAVRGMMPGMLLLAVAYGTKRAGMGDGIALMALGVISGNSIFPIFGLSMFFIAFFSLVLLVLRRAGRNTQIPYLPFLAAAWCLAQAF